MSDEGTTPRFGLPLLAMAQAQKEVTHDEALTLLDALIQPVIEAGPVDTVPSEPLVGQSWLVGAGADGSWAGHADDLAMWTAGGWRFVAPRSGMDVVRTSDLARLRFDGDGWLVPDEIANPDGGTIVDSEARAAINALISSLEIQGLLISG